MYVGERVILVNLSLLKELEDAKADLSFLSSRLGKLIDARVEKFISDATNDFTEYFKESEFTISNQSFMNEMVATYGNLQVKLSLPKSEDRFVGAYTVITLTKNGFNNKKNEEYSILVNELGRYPRVTSSFTTAPKTDEERILQQIDDVKKRIEQTKQKLDTFSDTKWCYGILDKNNKDFNYPQFETFKELLADHFK